MAILVGGKIQTQGKISDLIESGEKKMVCVFQIQGSIEDLKLSPDVEPSRKADCGRWSCPSLSLEDSFETYVKYKHCGCENTTPFLRRALRGCRTRTARSF